MCGIAGYVGQELPGLGLRMARLLAHRGPDDEGEEVLRRRDGGVAVLAHRRLSIIDLEGGHQPLANEDMSVQVVFNGEIYNFQELQAELEAAGHRFRTRCDTEVIVHLYEEHGLEFVHRLRGMFAFALWDSARERLVLVRDRLGVKPLYYAEPEGAIELAFGSELKALLEVPGVSRALDPQSLAAYLAYLYVPPPRSAVLGVRKLPPAHLLVHEGGRTEVRRYWSLDGSGKGEPDPEQVWRILDEAVRLRLIADVPVGALLSGGVDSSSIVAAAAAAQPDFQTFTVAFTRPDERHYDESADARLVAETFHTRHHELQGRADLASLLPRIVRHFDEPFGNPTALVSWGVCELTRAHVKVALDGAGSDELFAGYERFRGLAALGLYRRVPRPLRALAAAAARRLPESTRGRHTLRRAREFALGPVDPDRAYVDWITYFHPDERSALLTPAAAATLDGSPQPERFLEELFERAPRGDLVNRISFVDLQSYLPCNVLEYGDRMSMAHGLELRAPYCDHRLVEYAFSLPGSAKLRRGRTKAILRDALARRLPDRPLTKRKIGFNPPMGVWLNGELAPVVDEYLGRDVVSARGLFRPEAVGELMRSLRSGRRDVSLQVWSLVVLEQWLREYEIPLPT